MNEEEFIEYWEDELQSKYIDLINEFNINEELDIDVINAIDEYIRPYMERRAEDYGDDKIYPTISWGDFDKLEDLNQKDLNTIENALLNIFNRLHYWCWGFEEFEGERMDTIEQQNGLFERISEIVDEYI